jgi:hypothetical protein
MEHSDNITNNQPKVEVVQFVPIIHQFFNDVTNVEQAFSFLKKYTHCKIYEYTIVSTRKLFYALAAYKFGKELEYPEQLFTKARQVILYELQKKEDNPIERRKIFKDYLLEFDQYKEEDLKNYMYELGVQFHQLEEMRTRLSDHPEWLESIEGLQFKIKEQVRVARGENIFKECLDCLGGLKKEIVKQNLENAYWDMMMEDLSNNKIDLLMENYVDIKRMLLEMRDDQDTKEILDEDYIRQLLENNVFEAKTLASQIEFIYHKMKLYGVPIYDKLLDKQKNELIDDLIENGISNEMIIKVLRKTLPIVQNYLEIIRIYRKEIERVQNEKKK